MKQRLARSYEEMACAARLRRISEVEDSLARPAYWAGAAWDEERKRLERELRWLRDVVADTKPKGTTGVR